ncbi:Fmp42 protein [Martiniozyma asiatica (nom. inval.)]|nr:Fmp42 protein [Martiniozyma asiatica]
MSDSNETTPLILPVRPHQHLPSLKVRVSQIICAMIWCLFAAGPVFGFAALKPVLVDQGVYSEVCKASLESTACVEQDLKLNLMFTLAAVITNATALVVGRLLDTQGPRVTGIIGSIIIFVSALFLAHGKEIKLFDAYLYGYIGLAFGGPFVFISCFQLANSFPGRSGLILALLTGSFDSSSALFLFYRVIYQNDYVKNLTLKKFFTWYLIVPIFILVCQIVIMPHESYKTIEVITKMTETGIDESGLPMDPNDSRYQESEVSLMERSLSRRGSVKSNKSVFEEIADEQLKKKSGGIFGALHSKTVFEQYKTPWWYLMCFFTTIQMLRINYFVATIRSQMEFYFSPEISVTINKFFDVALPLGGIVAIPFIGLILDNMTTLKTLTILLFTSLAIGICGMVPIQFMQYVGILLLVLYRPFYYTAVSDYCAKVFGYANFGTVYGSIICFSGFMNLFQTELDNLTHFTFKMNPNPVNLTLLLVTLLCGISMISYIKSKERQLLRKLIVDEALME